MTDNEVNREKTFSEELAYFKEQMKDAFERYTNSDGHIDVVHISILIDTKRILRKAEEEINRQQKEVDRYERESNSKFDKWKLLDDRTKQRYAELYEEAKSVVRAEAIKEFAERLKGRQVRICDCFEGVSIIDIDKLLKEYEKGRQGNEFI